MPNSSFSLRIISSVSFLYLFKISLTLLFRPSASAKSFFYGEGMDIEQGFRQNIGHYFPHISEKGNAGFRDTPKDIVDLLESESMPDGWDSTGSSKGILVVDLRSGHKSNDFQHTKM